jgi:hypothetical protein
MSVLGSLGLVDEKLRPAKPYGLIKPALANVAPAGMKMWLLNLGYLEADESWILRGKHALSKTNPECAHRMLLAKAYSSGQAQAYLAEEHYVQCR